MKREDFFSNKLGISDPVLLATLVSSTSLCNYDKKTILVSEGMVQECVPFLVSGMLRGFFTDESGREITDCFSYKPGDVALGSCTYGSPSLLSIEVLQDNTQLLLLPVSGAESVVRSSVESMEICNQLLIRALARHLEGKRALLKYDARGKYLWFLKNYPELVGQVSDRCVASFLNMSPVTLSRLKRNMCIAGAEKPDGIV